MENTDEVVQSAVEVEEEQVLVNSTKGETK